jgi:glutamine amidotransferase
MGWNKLETKRSDPLSDPLINQWFYFVHSYAAPIGPWTLAVSKHRDVFSAVVRHENFYGTQFHPERSATAGAMLLENFLSKDFI